MAELPTTAQVLVERPDINDYIDGNPANLTLSDYLTRSLTQIKRDLRDNKGIEWRMIYNSSTSEYFVDADEQANNKDRIQNCIILLAIAYVFKDYSIRAGDSQWWELYNAYRSEYDMAFNQAKLDVDFNESGTIDADEDYQSQQRFFKL